jgi:GxxExxY protein
MLTEGLTENGIAREVVDAAYRIHAAYGSGLLESAYEVMLAHELRKRGFQVVCQQAIPLIYDGIQLEAGFRADMIVNDLVILELKSVEQILPVHRKQLLTYLRLADKRLGLLINFGAPLIRQGISRIVNGLHE